MPEKHICGYRVYYEDTDAAGIVYHSNYLKFAERARTEWLRSMGFEQSELMRNDGVGFIVRHCEADFLAPARLDDKVVIETCLQEAGKVRMKIVQIIKRGETVLVNLDVTVVCVKAGKPVRLPEKLRQLENRGTNS